MKTAHPIHLLAAALAGACLIAAPAEASSTNVNADADALALYCSWEPDYACAPGAFTFIATATCDGNFPPDPTQDVYITAKGVASGNASGANEAILYLSNVPPGKITVTFSGAGESFEAAVHSLKVDIVQEREDYCIHGGSDTLDLTEDSYLGPSENSTAYWYWDATYKTSGLSYFFTESNTCGATVRAEAEKLPSCDDTCEVNIVKVDLAAEGCVCVTNGPGQTAVRKQITINKCEPADWDGGVELLWSAGNVEVYTASTRGDKVTSGTTFANTALPKTLWVEGTAPSQYAGDVIFRLNPVEATCPNAANGCDRGTMTVINMVTETFTTDPADRTRTKVGVGENVQLTLHPSTLGPVTWSITGNGTLSAMNGNPVTFTAHDRASVPTITATYGSGSCDVTFNVVEPTSEIAAKKSEDTFPAGTQGAGMFLSPITVCPTDVSFANVEMLEVPGPASLITGYFTNFPASTLAHLPNTNWIQLTANNQWTDHAAFSGFPSPWYAGSFQWDIPVQWRVVGKTSIGTLPNRLQTFSIAGTNGISTVTKLGQSVTRTP